MDPRGMTKEQQHQAVESAGNLKALDALWGAWESVGFSRDGLLYAAVLEKRQEFTPLSEDEVAALQLAHKRRAHGQSLPPISGRRG